MLNKPLERHVLLVNIAANDSLHIKQGDSWVFLWLVLYQNDYMQIYMQLYGKAFLCTTTPFIACQEF